MLLSQESAAFVDAQVAPFAHRIGIAAPERLIDEAVARFMPEKAAEEARKAADTRHFTIDHQQVSFGGTSQVTGELDLADALDLATARGDALLNRWLFASSKNPIKDVMVAGQWVIQDGHHPLEETSASDFRQVLVSLLDA
jgi:hypothetical protein